MCPAVAYAGFSYRGWHQLIGGDINTNILNFVIFFRFCPFKCVGYSTSGLTDRGDMSTLSPTLNTLLVSCSHFVSNRFLLFFHNENFYRNDTFLRVFRFKKRIRHFLRYTASILIYANFYLKNVTLLGHIVRIGHIKHT